jgi:hypothetical protein
MTGGSYPWERRFEAIVFDWDGTAVSDRRADASRVRRAVERLCGAGVEVAIVSGTHVGNVDGQLRARPSGPGGLYLCLNRGSEVFVSHAGGVDLVHRRVATGAEDDALSAAAALTVSRLAARGLPAEVVSERLNRRKVDLIPEPAWADPPKAKIDELVVAVEERLHACGFAGLPEVAEIARQAGRDAGLADPRVTSDAKHVEIGLTDKSDSARWIFDRLWQQGIGSGLVLVVGDEMGPLGGLPGSDSLLLLQEAPRVTAVSVGIEPTGVPAGVYALGGGPERFLELLADQLERRRRWAVPELDEDPGWTLVVEGFDRDLERVHETLLTLGDGKLGTSGSPMLDAPGVARRVLAAGAYLGSGADTKLLPCPLWSGLGTLEKPPGLLRRTLDLRTGVLRQQSLYRGRPFNALMFPSLARPGTVALRADPRDVALEQPSVVAPPHAEGESGKDGEVEWVAVQGTGSGVTAAGSQEQATAAGSSTIERICAYRVGLGGAPEPALVTPTLRAARRAGYDRLLAEHRAAWAKPWEDADIVIGGDPELQLAVRFALFHLMASVASEGEAAVGARGLSGHAYHGHVFWDSDVFVLPFLAATHPASARAMLEYRIRRLPAARHAARATGRAGARFPWESAHDGIDVTPTTARDWSGGIVPIRTGLLEEHITADVAWAAACYLDWTGDREFATGPGLALFVETARYWASRIRLDRDGTAHIYGVIGPDEYHEPVDDNAFTNVMARWNLRTAARIAQASVPPEERSRWLELADRLVDGYDPGTRVFEQFSGFFDLEPLLIAEVSPERPVAADALLGRERVAGAQVVKQADVLMLHHLVPDEVPAASPEPNLRFYEPRTAHGSSLSPGIHAALFARLGAFEEALSWLRLTSRIDLDDVTGTTAGGLHMASMGSLWQALVFGFAGIRPRPDALELDPRLPPDWSALEVRLRFRGGRVIVRIDHEGVVVEAQRSLTVVLSGGAGQEVVAGPGPARLERPSGVLPERP